MKTKPSITFLALPLLAVLLSLTTVAAAQPGFISTVAGTGTSGFNGDSILATSAQLFFPFGVFVDGSGNIFIADFGNHRVRRVDGVTGLISTVAGTGVAGFNGDGILATTAQLFSPGSVFVDGSGNLFIADFFNSRVRKVDTAGLISTVAGTGTVGFNGDGILATSADLRFPRGVFVDGFGNIFIADQSNHRVRKVDTAGIISTVAGTGAFGFNGDGILATTAQLSAPVGVFVDGSGNIFIADASNIRVRKVNGTTGFISTVAGTGTVGFNGDGILATNAHLFFPIGVVVDGSGNIFIADEQNRRVRRVDGVTGLISTVAGTGVAGYNGDDIPAVTAQLNNPRGVFVDGSGNIFIADELNHRVRKVEPGLSVEAVVDQLINNIVALGLNFETALVHHLENALASFASGNESVAVNQLNAFIHHVEAQRGHALTDAEVDNLIAPVQAMINAINSGGANLRAGEPEAVPDRYALEGNYPNPFSIHTTIRFGLPESAQVRLVVYDVLGRQVRVLLDGTRQAGAHEVVFDTSDLPSGTYLYRLETPQGSFVRTMLLAK